MKLLGARLLLAPLPDQEKTQNGIILPQAQQGDVRYYWKVEQVGMGNRNKDGELVPMEFEVGETVITPLHFDHTVLEDGTHRRIVGVDQIIAKVEVAEAVQEI